MDDLEKSNEKTVTQISSLLDRVAAGNAESGSAQADMVDALKQLTGELELRSAVEQQTQALQTLDERLAGFSSSVEKAAEAPIDTRELAQSMVQLNKTLSTLSGRNDQQQVLNEILKTLQKPKLPLKQWWHNFVDFLMRKKKGSD